MNRHVALSSESKQPTTRRLLAACILSLYMASCGTIHAPDSLTVDVPDAESPSEKFSTKAVNRIREAPVVYVKLGEDVLKPRRQADTTDLPTRPVGPMELREETLAAALQLVLADTDIPMAFQTSEALARTVTVSQLRGPTNEVVERLCSLADLYCSYEKGVLVIKDVETFNVALPPLAGDNYDQFLNGIRNVTGREAYVDNTTRTMIYSASHRNNDRAKDYFDRLRTNTALIVFETQIWEVTLNNGNNSGIRWEALPITATNPGSSNTITNGNLGINATAPTADIAGALTGGLRYLSGDLNTNVVVQFLSSQGAVKTISQPQITVLSGSTAKLRVGNSQKYISQITRTAGVNATGDNLSLTTDTLQTGLNMEINSSWDNATVYGNLKLDLQNLVQLKSVSVGGENGTSIQLPETSERNLETRIRIRPGDALIIGGIVQEVDNVDKKGIGGMSPILPTSRTATARNSELVIMMRPHVVVYTENPPADAVLLNNGLYLQNPDHDKNLSAVNVMANTPPVVAAPTVPAPAVPAVIPAIAPAPVANPVQKKTLNLTTMTDPQEPPARGPIRPKPLSRDEVKRLQSQQKPAIMHVPPTPSMSQYLNNLAPMQIAPED
jgi:hypothetical protein